MPATRCFVIGNPIRHSRSPVIHGHWLAEHGIDGSYERIEVAPEQVTAFLDRLRAGEFAGGNVTVPNKEVVMPLLDSVSDTARRIGAVNTLWVADGRLHGDNTDAYGFLAHLDASAPGWDGRVRSALVLGAGGAAKAVAHGLAGRGLERIVIVNRGPERAIELAAAVGPAAEARPLAEAAALVGESGLIVNTTSLGMRGQPPLELDLAALVPGSIVYDIVYVPLETQLLAQARALGGVSVDGLGMLLHQAVPGFARWFGVRPAVTPALRALLEADLPRS